MQYIIGIDIGTTHTKAVVATTSAEIITEFKKTYKGKPSPGPHQEQDPDDIFNTVMTALKEVIATIEDKNQIACVSFSAAMHSIMALDHNGKPLTALYTWDDTRSHEQAARLKASEEGELIYRFQHPFPGFPAAGELFEHHSTEFDHCDCRLWSHAGDYHRRDRFIGWLGGRVIGDLLGWICH